MRRRNFVNRNFGLRFAEPEEFKYCLAMLSLNIQDDFCLLINECFVSRTVNLPTGIFLV